MTATEAAATYAMDSSFGRLLQLPNVLTSRRAVSFHLVISVIDRAQQPLGSVVYNSSALMLGFTNGTSTWLGLRNYTTTMGFFQSSNASTPLPVASGNSNFGDDSATLQARELCSAAVPSRRARPSFCPVTVCGS